MAARQYQAAMAEYEAAKAIDPKNGIVKQNIAECFNNMGIALFRQKAYSDALQQFQKCLDISPTHAKARYNMNLCHEAMEREGIPDTPAEPEEKPDKKADKDAESKSKEKEKLDSTPKVVDGSASPAPDSSTAVASPVQNSNTLYGSMGPTYASGSAMFPTYSKQPSAVNAANQIQSVLPRYTPAATAAAKQSQAQQTGASPAVSPATSAADAFDTIKTDGTTQQAQGNIATPGETSKIAPRSAGPENSPVQSTAPSSIPDYQAANTIPASSTSSSTGANMTLEDQVAALELKVYGKKSTEQTLLQRIGQLETDSIGATRQGSMKERVDNLRKTISHN